MPQIWSISKLFQLHFKNITRVWPQTHYLHCIEQVQATIFHHLDDYNSLPFSYPYLLLQFILNTVAKMIPLKYKSDHATLLLCEKPFNRSCLTQRNRQASCNDMHVVKQETFTMWPFSSLILLSSSFIPVSRFFDSMCLLF